MFCCFSLDYSYKQYRNHLRFTVLTCVKSSFCLLNLFVHAVKIIIPQSRIMQTLEENELISAYAFDYISRITKELSNLRCYQHNKRKIKFFLEELQQYKFLDVNLIPTADVLQLFRLCVDAKLFNVFIDASHWPIKAKSEVLFRTNCNFLKRNKYEFQIPPVSKIYEWIRENPIESHNMLQKVKKIKRCLKFNFANCFKFAPLKKFFGFVKCKPGEFFCSWIDMLVSANIFNFIIFVK